MTGGMLQRFVGKLVDLSNSGKHPSSPENSTKVHESAASTRHLGTLTLVCDITLDRILATSVIK